MSRGKHTAADRVRQLTHLVEAIERLVNEEKGDGDPPSAHRLPHEAAMRFVDGFKRYQRGKATSLDSALGLKQRGKPFDAAKSKNLPLAEKASRLRYFDKLPWDAVAARIDPSQPDAVDERALRKLIESHWPAICRNIADEVVGRRPPVPRLDRVPIDDDTEGGGAGSAAAGADEGPTVIAGRIEDPAGGDRKERER